MRAKGAIRTLAVGLLATVLAVTGCSSDEGSTGDGDGTTTTTTTTVAADSGPEEGVGPLERYADYESTNYDDPDKWVCRPDTEDICDADLTATVVEQGGATSVEEFTPADDPPVDCFYVYPTISRDPTDFSDWDASPEEEGFVTLQQAARLGEVCRVFAPVYRQRTLTSLASRLAGADGDDGGRDEGGRDEGGREEGDPFADVLDAFRTYMARDNDGRGVVLIGHSQGSSMLTELIRSEVDPNEDVRRLLVSAYLAGSAVAVPDGELVGGDFRHVPLCSGSGESGCVTTWATFRSDAPPPEGSLFGIVRQGDGVAGCVNPAAVEGGSAELQAYFPADASASILADLGTGSEGRSWLEGTDIETPFVSVPGLVTGECVSDGSFDYLSVTVHGDAADPRADDIAGDLTPEWGLHLVDVSIVMGDIVDRIAEQASAHAG